MPWGWIFAQIIGDGRSTEVAKIMVVHLTFDLFMAKSSLLPYVFVWAPYICIGKMLRIFKRLLHWSLWANVAQILCRASLGQGKERLLKWLWFIDQDGPPPPPPPPYMVKILKNLLLQNRRCLGAESLHKSSGTGGLPKLLKWWSYIKFDLWSLLGAGERKIVKMIVVHWLRWPPCPYMVKTFEDLLLQNQISLWALSLHKSSGTGDLPKLLKSWSYLDYWPFYGKVKFDSSCICMGPIYTFMWEKCWEFIFWTFL